MAVCSIYERMKMRSEKKGKDNPGNDEEQKSQKVRTGGFLCRLQREYEKIVDCLDCLTISVVLSILKLIKRNINLIINILFVEVFMAKDVTLADIASRVGVSTVAVSKALSGKPGVSRELRSKIEKIAEEMGYVPSAAGKTISNETGNIGVVIPERFYGDSFSFYGRLYEKVVRALYENNYYGILEMLGKEDEESGILPKVMQDEKVDGLILMGQMEDTYIKKMVNQTRLPVFFLDTYVPSAGLDTVISDGYYGMYLMTNLLIARGHRRIGYIGDVDATSSIADRYWGYRRALRENRIEFEPDWEMADRDQYGKTFDKIVESPGGMDSFVCNCDYTAHIIIKNLEDAGYRVPEDVSVVGFDNFLPAGITENRITSYEVNTEQMARLCVKSLIRKIGKKRYAGGIQIVTGRIVEKETVKDRRR
jgi:DNA-binding LacI/PurR family transcriptional regulator